MSAPRDVYEKHADEKVVPTYTSELDSDGSSSIETLTALIAEGEHSIRSMVRNLFAACQQVSRSWT
jgi:hypothetical protein